MSLVICSCCFCFLFACNFFLCFLCGSFVFLLGSRTLWWRNNKEATSGGGEGNQQSVLFLPLRLTVHWLSVFWAPVFWQGPIDFVFATSTAPHVGTMWMEVTHRVRDPGRAQVTQPASKRSACPPRTWRVRLCSLNKHRKVLSQLLVLAFFGMLLSA